MTKPNRKNLRNAAWTVFGFQYHQAVTDRDELRADIEKQLGCEMASQIERHVDVALGRFPVVGQPNPAIMKRPEFYDLLALELAVLEIADRIEAHGR